MAEFGIKAGKSSKNEIELAQDHLLSLAKTISSMEKEELFCIEKSVEDLQSIIEDVIYPLLINSLESDNPEYQSKVKSCKKMQEEINRAKNRVAAA